VVAHAFNPSTGEAEAGGFLSSRPGLQSEFQGSQGYTEKPCLEEQKKKKKKKSVSHHAWLTFCCYWGLFFSTLTYFLRLYVCM
jgi:hypothetical protein